jgi:hypothetical protein
MLYYAPGNAIVTAKEMSDKAVDLRGFYADLSGGRAPKDIVFSTGKLTIDNAVRGFYSGGNAVVTAEEMPEKAVAVDLLDFSTDLSKGVEPEDIALSIDELASGIAVSRLGPGAGAVVPWTQIGPHLPLTIMIREVYTGKYPSWGGKDMLVTSAVKSLTSFNAQPRAINFLKKQVPSKSRIERPSAATPGTPIIFYSPALLEDSLTLDLTMVFDDFPQEVFNQIGGLLGAAAGIPIFYAYSGYLMGASIVARIAGKIGEKIFDSAPEFNSSDAIDMALPGSAPVSSGFMLITRDEVDPIDNEFRSKYHVDVSGRVVDDKGQGYYGDIPYIVISLDGSPQAALTSFAPTAAGAAVLSKFFGMEGAQNQNSDMLVDAMKLYNDLNYRQQVDCIDEEIKQLSATNPAKVKPLKEKRDALVANILEDVLKPRV